MPQSNSSESKLGHYLINGSFALRPPTEYSYFVSYAPLCRTLNAHPATLSCATDRTAKVHYGTGALSAVYTYVA